MWVGQHWPALVAGPAAFLCYAVTLAPGLTWAHRGSDGGDYLAAALTRGVPHPPGYPTYIVLLRAALAIWPAEPARVGAWLSALCAALGVAVFADLAAGLFPDSAWSKWSSLVAALALVVSPSLWSQAVITEVHTLQFLFVILLTAPLWRWRQAVDHGRDGAPPLIAAGLLFGLALGNHLTILLLAVPATVWLWRGRRALDRSVLGRVLLAMALGLTAYLYLPLAAAGDPPVNWGDPRTPLRFWDVVSAQMYRPLAFGVRAGDLPGRVAAWASEGLRQFALPGLILAGLGLWRLDRCRHDIWRFTLLTALVFSIFAVAYDAPDSYLYLIPAWIAVGFWVAAGLTWTLDSFAHSRWPAVAPVLLAVALAMPVLQAARWFETMDARRDPSAERFLESVLSEAEPNAVLLTSGDARTFALWYAIYGRQRRPDLTPVNVRLYAFPWYRKTLDSYHPQLAAADLDAPDVAAFVTAIAQSMPVYRIESLGMDLPDLSEQGSGILIRLAPE